MLVSEAAPIHSIFALPSPALACMGSMPRRERREAEAWMRASGRMCSRCQRQIDAGQWPGGERLCNRCERSTSVILKMTLASGYWSLEFLDARTRLLLGPTRRVQHTDSIREMVGRTATRMSLEERSIFEMILQSGRGEVRLTLSGEQLYRVRARK